MAVPSPQQDVVGFSITGDEVLCPFEWLTDAESLGQILNPNRLFDTEHNKSSETGRTALHLGCGSSLLGEYLIQELHYNHVVNVDRDGDVLQQLKQRWERTRCCSRQQDSKYLTRACQQQRQHHDNTFEKKMEFIQLDFCKSKTTTDIIPGYFDLVVDKSTLDCTMCSNDDAASGQLCLAHDSLKKGGVYVVISFHDVNFLLPLLKDCPGTSWIVEHHAVPRQAEENLTGAATNQPLPYEVDGSSRQTSPPPSERILTSFPTITKVAPLTFQRVTTTKDDAPSVWSSGIFDPSSNDAYRKWVNVVICRKTAMTSALDRHLVQQNIHSVNNEWFKFSNPMLTATRQERLKQDWFQQQQKEPHCETDSQNHELLDLTTCYNILFTDAEREHLTFEYFMEDWYAFLKTNKSIAKDKMSLESALAFLEEMQ